MTKIRPSLTPESALDRVVGLLGRDDAASIIEKTPSGLYAYADPDKDKHISLRDAMKLDASCLIRHNETPFLLMQNTTLEATGFRGRQDLSESLLNLHASAGRLNEAVRAAKSPQSPGGQRLTQQEVKRIHDIADQVLAIVHEIRAGASRSSGECHVPQMRPFAMRHVSDAQN